MPRKVDHEERRRQIVEALLRVTGERGLEAVSLREVAHEAGVSMGTVQHYFASKDEMLLGALRHWLELGVHAGFAARVRESWPDLRVLAAEYLPHDEASRAEARVALAFLSRAAVSPAIADALAPALRGFTEAIATATHDAGEARRFAALLDGLRFPVLIGALSHADALAVVDRHLGPPGPPAPAAR